VKRKSIITGLILLATMSFASVQTDNFREAKKLAADENKPILIDFMTDW